MTLRNWCESTLPTSPAPSLQNTITSAAHMHLQGNEAPACNWLCGMWLCTHLLHDRCIFRTWHCSFPTSRMHACSLVLASSIHWFNNPASSSAPQNAQRTLGITLRVSGGHCGYHAPPTSSSWAGGFSRVRGWFSGLPRFSGCLSPRTTACNLVFLWVHVALRSLLWRLTFLIR